MFLLLLLLFFKLSANMWKYFAASWSLLDDDDDSGIFNLLQFNHTLATVISVPFL